jgi:hypothetical protein
MGYCNNPIDTTVPINIFYKHFCKRDGALWKDLAGYNHHERIQMLEGFVASTMDMYFNAKPQKDYEFCLRGAKFYCRLIRWIRKHPNIPVQT